MQRKTLIHSFIHSIILSFIHSSRGSLCSPARGGDGCAAVGSPLLAGARARREPRPDLPRALTRQLKSNEGPNFPNNHKGIFFPAGDQLLHDFVQGEADSNADSNFHKFFMPRLVTYRRETGDAAWGEDVVTFPL